MTWERPAVRVRDGAKVEIGLIDVGAPASINMQRAAILGAPDAVGDGDITRSGSFAIAGSLTSAIDAEASHGGTAPASITQTQIGSISKW